ncbi:MAG: hypothetical protein HQL31_05100 [Planctomycetes bacterium]|nr:hypothetical protein [Planctomycetota bacterium]
MTPIDPLHSEQYRVSIHGVNIPVYGSKSCKAPFPFKCFKRGEHPGIKLSRPDAAGGPAQIAEAGNAPYWFCSLVVEEDQPVEVVITGEQSLAGARVHPAHAAEVVSAEKDRLVLRIKKPGAVSVEIKEEHGGRHGGLLLFADAPETEIPDANDPKVHFYGAGLHRVEVIHLRDNETLYLAPGAIIEGGVCIENAKNVRIMGRGIICGDPWGWRDGPQKDLMMFTDSEIILVEGITLRCGWQWTFRMTGCSNITIRNIKICGGKNLNDDGIDPSSCQSVLIDKCFIRTHDDNISVKAHCDDRRPCEKIEIRNCTHWSDLSRILMVGPESYADRIGDIHMHHCEILWLGPPINKTGFGDWDGCAPAFCFQAGEDCTMENIVIENITLHLDADRDKRDLILIEPLQTVWAKRDTLGKLRKLWFRNMECLGPWQPRICVWGKDEEHDVQDVCFKNIVINNELVDESYPQLSLGDYTSGITFG